MTDDEMIIQIAEACGIEIKYTDEWGRSVYWLAPKNCPYENLIDQSGEGHFPLPDYLNDLNAMHEAEKTLKDEQWRLFLAWVCEDGRIASIVHSTARQRAEAFIKTIEV